MTIYNYVLNSAIVSVVVSLTATACFAEESLPPRLWEFWLPNGTHSFVLGITHSGLAAEQDAYFTEKVQKKFDVATQLIYEGAVFQAYTPECSEPLKTEAAKQEVAAAREFVRQLQEAEYREIRDKNPVVGWSNALIESMAKERSKNLAEYELLVNARGMVGLTERQAAEAATEPEPTNVINLLAHRRPDVTRLSIEEPEQVAAAYCAAGQKRIEHFRQEFNRLKNIQLNGQSKKEREEARRISAAKFRLGLLNPKGNVFGDFDPIGRWLICDRNRNWLAKMLNASPGETPFYAFGFSHLVAYRSRDGECGGLLQDLSDAGARVELVK